MNPLVLLAALASTDPSATAGVVEVRGWSAPTSLQGTWLFRAGDVAGGADPHLDDGAWEQVTVPKGLGAQGHKELLGDFWLRLHIRGPVPGDVDQLGIQIQDVDSASEVFADGVFIGGRGSIRVPQREDEAHPGIWPLPRGVLDDGEVVIAVHGWRSEMRRSSSPARGGIVHGPNKVGPTAELAREFVTRDLDEWLLVGSFLVVGLYHLQLFRRRRQLREYLWFGIFSMLIAGYVLTQVAVVGDLFPQLSTKTWFLLVSLSLLSFIEFLWPFMREPIGRGWRVWQAAAGLWCIVATLWPTAWFTHRFLVPWELVILSPFLVGAVALIARRAWAGDPEARTIVLGTVLMVLTSVNNILRSVGLQTPEITNWAFAGFVLSMAASLSNRFTRVYTEVDELLAETLRLGKLKDAFLANTSHELRTPLNAIINIPRGVLESLAERPVVVCSACEALFEADEGTETGPVDDPCPSCGARALAVHVRRVGPEDVDGLARHLQTIVRSGEHLLTVVNDILDASKIAAGGMELSLADVSIADVARQAQETVEPMARARGVKLEVAVPEALTLRADRTRLVQVLLNLVNNAVTFSPSDGIVRVSARVEGTAVYIDVVDHGPGIAPEHHALIFEPFRQVDASHTRRHGGTGLGLAIARQLAELHHGTLTVASTLGHGATFTLRLPLPSTTPE